MQNWTVAEIGRGYVVSVVSGQTAVMGKWCSGVLSAILRKWNRSGAIAEKEAEISYDRQRLGPTLAAGGLWRSACCDTAKAQNIRDGVGE